MLFEFRHTGRNRYDSWEDAYLCGRIWGVDEFNLLILGRRQRVVVGVRGLFSPLALFLARIFAPLGGRQTFISRLSVGAVFTLTLFRSVRLFPCCPFLPRRLPVLQRALDVPSFFHSHSFCYFRVRLRCPTHGSGLLLVLVRSGRGPLLGLQQRGGLVWIGTGEVIRRRAWLQAPLTWPLTYSTFTLSCNGMKGQHNMSY